MSAQAGWYPDPSGNADKLRFWDGNQWTSEFMDAAAVSQVTSQTQAQTQAASQSVSASTQVQSEVSAQPAQTTSQQGGVQTNGQSGYASAQQVAQQSQQSQQSQQPVAQQPQSSYQSQPYQQPAQTYQQPNYSTPVPTATTTYAVSGTDTTLRLIAFVFNILTIVSFVGIGIASFGIGLIPLAWIIPMTVMSWQVYQGTRANTVALGVCTLIFANLVSGILLLCSTKER